MKDQNYYNVVTHSYGADFTWDIPNGKVTVPANCFITFASGNLSGIEGVDADDSDADMTAPAEYYDLNGLRVAEPVKGLYIVRQGSKTYKVVL